MEKQLAVKNSDMFDDASISEILQDVLKIVTPSWPLQNGVAVNPFWNFRDRSFTDVIHEMSQNVAGSFYMPIAYYKNLYTEGKIDTLALTTALEEAKEKNPELPSLAHAFVTESKEEKNPRQYSFAEFVDHQKFKRESHYWHRSLRNEASKFLAAYFDKKQSLTPFPWRKEGILEAWMHTQSWDLSLGMLGIRKFRQTLKQFQNLGSEEVIQKSLSILEINTKERASLYLRRLLLSTLGWASRIRYGEWQHSLGYRGVEERKLEDVVAVLCLLEVCLFEEMRVRHPELLESWKITQQSKIQTGEELHLQVWHRALELTYEEQVSLAIQYGEKPEKMESPRFQAAFCIDVRSEILRRHIESSSNEFQTIGFAGFFGIPLDFHRLEHQSWSHRCPVLLSTNIQVMEHTKSGKPEHELDRKIASGFYRKLRKSSTGSFAYVEFLGLFSLWSLLKKTVLAMGFFVRSDNAVKKRFDSKKYEPDLSSVTDRTGNKLTIEEKAERVEFALTHMGIKDSLANLVLICGHGSNTANNAFGATLDCGACGGHAGDMNARVLCHFANDPDVRKALSKKGISIPDTTWFHPGFHETVTDEVFLLDRDKVPTAFENDAREAERIFSVACRLTRDERKLSRTSVAAIDPFTKSRNWSEVRPEWGLTGNAAFIIAPRERTKKVNLGSRVFLHDYYWEKDKELSSLELILSAPMVVANWINLQYYASTVQPNLYGAGSKILHNLVNECGVLEGNSGDFRIGLPLQSVHDGHRFIHEPIRLLVYVEAPRDTLESVISKHEVVRQLVENEWVLLHQIEPKTGKIWSRKPGGFYKET